MSDEVLHIVEMLYEGTNAVQIRYAGYLSSDASYVVRHGAFRHYHESGRLASEGTFVHDREDGSWRDYHDNGALAAEGDYADGSKSGVWRYYDDEGNLELTETFPSAPS